MVYHNQKEIRKFLAPEIVFGEHARTLAAKYIHFFGGGKVLVVSDVGVRSQPWYQEIIQDLKQENIQLEHFDEVSFNPPMEEVHRGAEQFQEKSCKIILSIGGGSPMDCAKGIGIISSNGGDIRNYEGVDMVKMPIPPHICIPSTAGTAADLSQFSIITDTEKHYKMAIISKSIVPDVSLSDPLPLTTMDSYLGACTGVDALVHAIEAYVSNASSSMTDLFALQAVSLVINNLEKSLNEPMNLKYKNAMMTASMKAGLAFSNASLGCVHAMAHSLGGLKDLPHGECNALILPQSISFNFQAQPQRYRELAQAMGLPILKDDVEMTESMVQFLKDFNKKLGILGGLEKRSVTLQEVPKLAEIALGDACMATNPRTISQREMEQLFEDCFE